VFDLEGPGAVDFWGILISSLRIRVEAEVYVEGSASGDTVEFDDGHSSTKPAGNCVSGVTRKLRLDIALWTLKKYSVISLDENT